MSRLSLARSAGVVVTFTLVSRKPPRRGCAARVKLDGSVALAFQLRAVAVPEFKTQYKFHPVRKWTFDIAFVERQVAIEVDGGLYLPGGAGHTRGKAREDDMEKDAEAMILGWRVLRVSSRHVRTGTALNWIERILREQSA